MLAAANQTILVLAFAGYTLVIVAVGLYSARYARRTDEDFFLAGRSLGKWVAALSASASSESGWVTLGLVGMGYSQGVAGYWLVPGCLIGYAFIWFVMAGRMRDRAVAIGAVTVPDFFALHFGERFAVVRTLSVVVILTAMLLYVAAQFAAAGKAFAAAFPGIGYQQGVLIGAAIVLVYTVSGGFRAVCWTDLLQALLMLGVLVVFPIYLLSDLGGYGAVLDRLRVIDGGRLNSFVPQGVSGLGLVGFVFGASALGINFGYPGQPHVVVRFMALRDRTEARVAGVIAMIWAGLVLWGAVTVGIAARVMAEQGAAWAGALEADAELSLVVTATHLLPQVISGMVLAAVLAAICSTADSQLVVAASAAANDVYARLFARDGQGSHVWIDRLVVFALGVGAVLLVIDQKVTVYAYVLTYGWAILGAAFGPQLILVLLWRRATYAGCVAGMVTGFAVPVLWKLQFDGQIHGVEVYNLPFGFVCALVVNVLVSMATRPPDSAAQDCKISRGH